MEGEIWTFVIFVILSVGSVPIQNPRKTYHLDKLVRVHPTTNVQVRALERLQDNPILKIDFWKRPHLNTDVEIHVPIKMYNYVTKKLSRVGLQPIILVYDLQSVIDQEQSSMQNPDYVIDSAGAIITSLSHAINQDIVGKFARHSEIDSWLTSMALQYPTLAKVESLGTSHEGRDMKIIKLGKNDEGRAKPVIWIEAGIHAREWIAPATAIYTINKLLTEYGSDSDVTRLMDEFDWHIIPSANPDGYEYSHTTDRLWRKTRSRQSGRCVGVDPNRNFDISFGGAGTSTNPCSDIYPGTRAFSESETSNIRDAILTERARIKLFLSFHAYSQLLLTPYGYTNTKPSDNEEMMRVAEAGMASLKTIHGEVYTAGTPPDLLYAASGGSYDWAKSVAGIKYAYTYEMRPAEASFGQSGFILPESEIIPNAEEVWASLVTIATEIQY
ncbi:carboxypeptidase B-like isoform X1 [Saccostrea cucullata]|uniref:carboxypeptidase B-like isoform X1 n=1 Tax=Saccostrea cuccullata TaxID=36930 RepID=UPI002ED447F9